MHDFFYPRRNLVACGTSWLVEVYGAVPDVFLCWSLRGYMPKLGVGGILIFRQQFTFDLPRRGCSGHLIVFSP